MAHVAELSVAITAETTGLQTGLRQADQGVSQLQRSLQSAAAALAGLGIGAAVTSIARLGVEFLSLKEQAQIAFTTMLGSAQLAESFLKDLADFAARTPFEFPDLIRAAQRLTAMGFAARDVIPMLTGIGDAAAAMGASSVTIDRITIALGQMAAKGKVSAEEMRQLAETGIPVWQILADKIGKTIPEAMKLAEKGMLDGKKAVADLIDGIEHGTKHVQAFAGMMDKQSKTAQGLASTLKDLGRQALGDILLPAFNKLRDVMARLVEEIPKAVAWFQSLSEDTKNGILAFGAVIAIAPLVVGALGLIGTAISALLSPIGLVVIALGALSVAYASNLGGIRDSINEFAGAVHDLWHSLNTFLQADAAGAWKSIASQISDSMKTIATIIKGAAAEMKGDWSGAWKAMGTVVFDTLNSVGDFLTRWMQNLPLIGGPLRELLGIQKQLGREILGIQGGVLEFKAPSLVPGLPSGDVLRQAEEYMATAGRKIGGAMAKGMGKGLKEDGFNEVQDWLRSTGNSLDLAKKTWDTLGGSVKNTLRELAREYAADQVSTQRWAAILTASLSGVGLEVAKLANGHLVLKSATIAVQSNIEDLSEKIDQMIIPLSHVESVTVHMAEATIDNWQQVHDGLIKNFEDLSRQLPQSFNSIADAILNKSGRVGDELLKFGIKVKGYFNDVLGIIDNLPGKIGDTLRKITSEFDRWVKTIDSVLALLNRIFNTGIGNIGDLLGSVIGTFKKATDSISQGSEDWAVAMNTMAKGTASATTSILGSLKNLASGIPAITGLIGAAFGGVGLIKQGGFLGGALGGGLLGAAGLGGVSMALGLGLGALSGPFAPFVIGGGALIGALLGMFHKKTPLEKAKEEATIADFKAQAVSSQQAALQAVEQTKQSILDTGMKIRDLLTSITFYTSVPQKSFDAFFDDLDKLMRMFADRAKEWVADSSGKMKVFSEDIRTVVEGIAQAPLALTAIGKYLGIPESSIVRFFTDLGKVLTVFGTMAEEFTRKFLRHLRQFAERIQPATDLLGSITDSIKGMVEIKPIPIGSFDVWETSLREFVKRLGDIAEFFDKFVVKEIGFFAETVAPGVELWKNSIDAIKSMVDIPVPTQADFDNLFSSIKAALEGMATLAETMNTEALVKAQSIAESSMSIFAAIKAAVESLGALRGYQSIASETFDALVADFDRALDLMGGMIGKSEQFIQLAKTFEDNMRIGAAHLAGAIDIFLAAIKNLGYGLAQFGIQVVVPTGALGTESLTVGTQAASSGWVGTGGASTPVTVIVNVEGSLVHETQLDDRIMRAVNLGVRRGQLGIGRNSSIPSVA